MASTFTDVRFGLYDLAQSPGAGWVLAAAADLEKYKYDFVESYNKGGIAPIGSFESGNCCIALRGGVKLTIEGSKYGYQFPANLAGAIRCNPEDRYGEAAYQFFGLPKLAMSHRFGEQAACATSHNPAIYIQLPDPKQLQFGVYDYTQTPPGVGWDGVRWGGVG